MKVILQNEFKDNIVDYDIDIFKKVLIEFTKAMPLEKAFDLAVEELKEQAVRKGIEL